MLASAVRICQSQIIMLPSILRIGTRASPLAMEQTNLFVHALKSTLYTKIEIVPMTTTGDQITDRPLAEIGGKGLFSKELEKALLTNKIDCAVHSLKDLEHTFHPDLTLAAVLPREVPWDVLVTPQKATLMTLPHGSVLGTCSPRRQAQLLHLRPDFKVVTMRGNIQTRLGKLEAGHADGLILAQAGLKRLAMEAIINEVLPLDMMIPSVGQGTIAIQTRKEDRDLIDSLTPINDSKTFQEITCERAMLKTIQGDCYTPIAGYAQTLANQEILLTAMIAHNNQCFYETKQGKDPHELGQLVGEKLKELTHT